MSIPDDFNILGESIDEEKYIQPIMTSPTTWSNTPSFGMAFSPTAYGKNGGRVLSMFDGNADTRAGIYGKWQPHTIELNF